MKNSLMPLMILFFALVMPLATIASPEISFSVPSPQQVAVGSNLFFTFIAASTEGTTPTVTVTNWPPGGIHYDESIVSGTVTGTVYYLPSPSAQFGSPYDVTFIADDGINPPVSKIMTIEVVRSIPGKTGTAITNYSFLNGQFQFEVAVGRDQLATVPRVIQASTNLIDWVTIGTNSCGLDETCVFPDPNSTNLGQRFYRVAQPAETNLSVTLP